MVFVKNIREYKVSSKFIKSVGATVYIIGFPVSEVENGGLSLAHISEKIGANGFEENEGNIIFLLNDMGMKKIMKHGKRPYKEDLLK